MRDAERGAVGRAVRGDAGRRSPLLAARLRQASLSVRRRRHAAADGGPQPGAGTTGADVLRASLPLGLMLLALNSGLAGKIAVKPPRPVVKARSSVGTALAVRLAPVRDGLRWIDVADPRTRRGDKLQPTAQSD